jgi:hypothetical protein
MHLRAPKHLKKKERIAGGETAAGGSALTIELRPSDYEGDFDHH